MFTEHTRLSFFSLYRHMWVPFSYRFFLLVSAVVCPSLQKETELHIGTLLPDLALDRQGFKNGMELAAETVHNQSLLKGYKLVFHHKGTLVRIVF